MTIYGSSYEMLTENSQSEKASFSLSVFILLIPFKKYKHPHQMQLFYQNHPACLAKGSGLQVIKI
jgi:hypothetical protein